MNGQPCADFKPPATPPGWRRDSDFEGGCRFVRMLTPESVIISESIEEDGRRWLHFSMAHPYRLPAWADLVRAKEIFLGAEAKAIQVLAPRSEWVNVHPFCLHLFVCLDGDVLPDFRRGPGML